MEGILKKTPENLIGFYEKLEVFAQHHQLKGIERAKKIILNRLNEEKKHPRDGSELGLARDEGYDLAFKTIVFLLDETLSKTYR